MRGCRPRPDTHAEMPPLALNELEGKIEVDLLRLGREKPCEPQHSVGVDGGLADELRLEKQYRRQVEIGVALAAEDLGELCHAIGALKVG